MKYHAKLKYSQCCVQAGRAVLDETGTAEHVGQALLDYYDNNLGDYRHACVWSDLDQLEDVYGYPEIYPPELVSLLAENGRVLDIDANGDCEYTGLPDEQSPNYWPTIIRELSIADWGDFVLTVDDD